MKKPGLRQIFVRALFLAGSLTAGVAGIIQTWGTDDFSAFRKTASLTLAQFFPFWVTIFALLTLVIYAIYLTLSFGKRSNAGSILSNEGILLFDREQQIAINVATIKSILSTLGNEAPKGRANEILYRAGELAGKRFGDVFSDIYAAKVEAEDVKPWAKLSDNEKLDAWERYDATAGWGHISAHKYENRSIVDVVYRHPALYEGAGGELFAWLLAGYSREVVSSLLGREVKFDSKSGFLRDEGILRLGYSY